VRNPEHEEDQKENGVIKKPRRFVPELKIEGLSDPKNV